MTLQLCNQAGITLIKSFESCRLTAYLDPGGLPTIGWGAVGSDIYIGLSWMQQQADERFADDLLTKAEVPVSKLVRVELTPNQFAALCSFCFNEGSGHLAKSSALAMINNGDLDHVPEALALWNEINGVVSTGLVRRRLAEIALWSTP